MRKSEQFTIQKPGVTIKSVSDFTEFEDIDN